MLSRVPVLAVILAVLAVLAVRVASADAVYLYLKANGQEIHGGCEAQGHETSIECLSYDQAVTTPRDTGQGLPTGKRTYQPIVIRKRIDQASPLLSKALVENQKVDGVLKFFHAVAGGNSDNYYTVEFRNGRIASSRQLLLDSLIPGNAKLPAQEEVTFVFHFISWTWNTGGVTYQDSWN